MEKDTKHERLLNLVHSINTDDPNHVWYEAGVFLNFIDNTQWLMYHCDGCSAKKRELITYPRRIFHV